MAGEIPAQAGYPAAVGAAGTVVRLHRHAHRLAMIAGQLRPVYETSSGRAAMSRRDGELRETKKPHSTNYGIQESDVPPARASDAIDCSSAVIGTIPCYL